MSVLGEAVIQVTGDTSRLKKDIAAGTNQAFGNVPAQSKSWGGRASAAFGGALKKGLLVGGAAAATGGIAAIGTAMTKGFTRLSAIEEAESKLTGLGHSSQNVAKIMANANKAVVGTAFGLGDAASAAASAVASGVKPGKDLTRTLKLIGDTATIAGVDYGEMAPIFNKVAATGKVQGEVLQQLGERGIPIIQLLAKEMGLSTNEVLKLSEQGKIGFKEFQAAIESGMGGAAQESGKTFRGSLANVGAAVGRFGAAFLGPAFKAAPKLFIGLQDTIDGFIPHAERAGTAVLNFMNGLKNLNAGNLPIDGLGAFGDVLSFVRDQAGKLVTGLKDAFAGIDFGKIFGNLATVAGAVGVALAAVGVVLGRLVPPLITFVGNIAESKVALYGLIAAFVAFKVVGMIRGIILGVRAALALQTAATLSSTAATRAHGIAMMLQVGWYKAVRIATIAWAGAQRIAAAAQWALNIAMRANPIGIIITLITGLVAGLVIAYKRSETFRNIVNGALRAVGAAAQWLWNKVIKPVGAFIGNAFLRIGSTVQRVWQNWIRPVLNAYGVIFRWLWNKVLKPVGAFIVAVFLKIGQTLRAVWRGFLQPVFQLFGAIVRWLWGKVIKVVSAAIRGAFNLLGRIVRSVWRNLIKPAIEGWGIIFRWLWNKVIKPTAGFIRAGFNVLGRLVRWVWRSLIKPAIDAWAAIFRWLWRNIIKPIAASIGRGFRAIGTGIRWVWNSLIKPAINGWARIFRWIWREVLNPIIGAIRRGWSKMGDLLRSVYTNVIKKVFNWFGRAGKTMGSAFSNVIKWIGNRWKDLKNLAMKPVKFVIDTVINKGLIGGFNKLADFFETKKLKPVPSPFKSGGVLPGYTPGRDVHRFTSPTGGALDLSGGEAVMRPEFTKAVGGKRGVDMLNRMARKFAAGGVFAPAPGKGDRHSGYPWATWAGDYNDPPIGMGTPVRAWKAGQVSEINRWGHSYGNHVRMNHGDNTSSLYAHLSKILVRVGQRLAGGQFLGRVGSTGKSTGPHLHFETMGGIFERGRRMAGNIPAMMRMGAKALDPRKVINNALSKAMKGFNKFSSSPFGEMVGAMPKKIARAGINWFNNKKDSFDAAGLSKNYGADRMGIAKTIVSTARKLGLGDRGSIIGLITGIVESGLRNVNYGDRDSLGVFQQRAPWGSASTRRNVAKAAMMFFTGGQGGQPGLMDYNWRSMGMGEAAQKVQVSQFPGRYAEEIGEARSILARLKAQKMDTGGWLKPGHNLVYNGTGGNERVRSGSQERELLDAIRKLADSSRGGLKAGDRLVLDFEGETFTARVRKVVNDDMGSAAGSVT